LSPDSTGGKSPESYGPVEGALSKARRIRELLEAGKKPAEIAALVGCLPEYVRVVRQRRLNPERTQALESAYKHRRYRADGEYRERVKARNRTRQRAARAVTS
jgi:hypothetical protein